MSDMREFINLVEGKQTTSKKMIKESFVVQGREFETKEFDSREATNAFLEENEFYGFIGEKDGKFHVAKNEDTGTPVEEEKTTDSNLEEITFMIGDQDKAESIMQWIKENDLEIKQVDNRGQDSFRSYTNYKGVSIDFTNGESYDFYPDETNARAAAFESVDSLIDDVGINVFGEGYATHYIRWEQVGQDYADDEYNYGYESPESFLDDEQPADDGDWSEEQKERAGELSKQRVLDDPQEFVDGIYGDDYPKEFIDQYVDKDKAIDDSLDQYGLGHTLNHYDGGEEDLDNDVLAYRTN